MTQQTERQARLRAVTTRYTMKPIADIAAELGLQEVQIKHLINYHVDIDYIAPSIVAAVVAQVAEGKHSMFSIAEAHHITCKHLRKIISR